MPNCPTCGDPLADNARFCPKDGTTLRPDTAPIFEHPEALLQGVTETMRGKTSATGKRETPDPLPGAILDGRYRVRQRLGQGGVGAVYEGEHVETHRPVAIKVLHAIFAGTGEFHKRFEREARAASKLSHPACVSVIDYGRIERVEPVHVGEKLLGVPYLVMELVRGQSLAERLTQPMTAPEAVVIARGVASALKHAHGLGIVHRDIKPANVMLVDGSGTGFVVKLLDFGLAKVANDDGDHEQLTQAGTVFGTPGYLSPEQAGGLPADARSDLYALGIMLYELVTGRRPFVRKDPIEVVKDHLHTPPPSPRTLGAPISSELEAVILRALAKDPAARWQTADEFSRALAETPEGGHSPTQPAQPVPTHVPVERSATMRVKALWQRVPRNRQALVLGGVVLAVILTMTVVVVSTAHKHDPARLATLPAPPVQAAPFIPEDALRHVQQAVGYQRRLWCSNALEELDAALREAPALGSDETLQHTAIACLTPKTRDKALRFVVERLGAAARPALETAATDASPDVRRGAKMALDRLPQ
ncbi:MAG TPA: protein kinase [Polyangia bacterium]|nr:protein kinase [Polyangia bacterium]